MAEMAARIEVQATESIARLSMEFRALGGFQMLTPDLEPKVSDGLSYRRLFVCHGQNNEAFRLTGRDIYQLLLLDQSRFVSRSVDFIRQCASFTDIWFFTRFPAYLPLHWRGKRVYGWKTCFRIGHPSQCAVPYLDCSEFSGLPEQVPCIRYHYLNAYYGQGDYAAIRT